MKAQKLTQYFNHKKTTITFCLLVVTSIAFWACRKQDLQTNDLQVTTKELQTWLSKNGGNYAKGQLLTKDANGKINKSVLNWGQIRHISANDKDFYEIPFIFTNSSNGNMATFNTNNSQVIRDYKIVFQKSVTGEIQGRIEIIAKEDTSLSKQYKAKSFDKMFFFDDLQSKRKSVWVGFSNKTYIEVYKKAIALSNNITNSVASTIAKQTVILNDQGSCLLSYSSANSSFECWPTPYGEKYDVTCGYVSEPPSIFIFDICSGGGSSWDIDFNYGGFLGSGGSSGGNSPSTPTTLDSLNAFNNRITDSLHPCLDSILDKLKGIDSGKIATIIKKFSGETPNWDWKIIEGVLPTNVNGRTSSVITNGTITTTLDYSKLNKATDLSVGRTIMHEAVHAYLTLYFRYDPINAAKDYPGMVKAWSKAKNPNYNNIQHDQFVKSFIDDLALALQKFGQSLGYTIDKSIYVDLAWGGLDYVNNSELSDDDKIRINNRLNAEQFNSKYGDEEPSGKKACNQ